MCLIVILSSALLTSAEHRFGKDPAALSPAKLRGCRLYASSNAAGLPAAYALGNFGVLVLGCIEANLCV